MRAFCGAVKGLVEACGILTRTEEEQPPLRAALLLPPGDGGRQEALEALSECHQAVTWPLNAKERPRIHTEGEVGKAGSPFCHLMPLSATLGRPVTIAFGFGVWGWGSGRLCRRG